MKKDFIRMMLKKYNCQSVKVVEKINPNFAGSISNNECRIIFDIEKGTENSENQRYLVIQDTITKDNIHLYYEFMSDEELKKQKDIEYYLTCVMTDRRLKVLDLLKIDLSSIALGDNKKISYLESRKNWIIGQIIFEVKDTLKPIEEYIKEIKESDSYKSYIANKS